MKNIRHNIIVHSQESPVFIFRDFSLKISLFITFIVSVIICLFCIDVVQAAPTSYNPVHNAPVGTLLNDLNGGEVIMYGTNSVTGSMSRFLVLQPNYTDAQDSNVGSTYVMMVHPYTHRSWHDVANDNNSDYIDFITNNAKLGFFLNSVNNPSDGADTGYYRNLTASQRNFLVARDYDYNVCKTEDNICSTTDHILSSYITLPSSSDWYSFSEFYYQAVFDEGYNNADNYFYQGLWLRTPYEKSTRVYSVDNKGLIQPSSLRDQYGVNPVLNLKSSIQICAGSGTYNDPYYLRDGNNGVCNSNENNALSNIIKNSLESLQKGEVIEFASKRYMKMGDKHEFLYNNRYFLSLDSIAYQAWDLRNTGYDNVWSNINTNKIGYFLNTTYYATLANEEKNKLEPTAYGVGFAADERSILTPDNTKISLVSVSEYASHVINYCRRRGDSSITPYLADRTTHGCKPTSPFDLTSFWERSKHFSDSSTTNSIVYLVGGNGIYGAGGTQNKSEVVPTLNLISNICVDTQLGNGTATSPYPLKACNITPTTPVLSSIISSTWYNSTTTITIDGSDALDDDEDPLTMEYSFDNGNNWISVVDFTITNSSTGDFTGVIDVSSLGNGNKNLIVRTYDGIAYSENSQSVSLNIDRLAPTCLASSWQPSEATWKNTQEGTTFGISCADMGGSGLDNLVVTPTCTTAPVNGATCHVQIYDNAGNVSLQYTSPVNKVDIIAPVGEITVTGGQFTGIIPDIIYQISPSISYSPTDQGEVGVDASGIGSVKSAWIYDVTTASDQGGNQDVTCEQALANVSFFITRTTIENTQIPRNGTHTFCAQAKDIAGNLSVISSQTFTLNTSTPTITGEITNAPSSYGGWYTTSPIFTIQAHDNNKSGLAGIYYRIIDASTAALLPTNYDVTTDTNATFIPVDSVGQLDQTYDVSFADLVGSFYIYYAATDATTGIDPSETLREQIRIDLTAPVSNIGSIFSHEHIEPMATASIVSDDPNYVLYQNTNQASPSTQITSQIVMDINSDLNNTTTFIVDTNSFDPLPSDLTTAGPVNVVSGTDTCLLQIRAARILTDGTGKIESTFINSGDNNMEVINFSPWFTLSTTCAEFYSIAPLSNMLYQLRLTSSDKAGHISDTYVSQTTIYNLNKIYAPDFITIDNNVISSDLAGNIMVIDCTSSVCIPERLDILGSLGITDEVATYEICLHINDTKTTKCTQITSSTKNSTSYSLPFEVFDFPTDIDVFPGGTLTVTDTNLGSVVVKQANIVFQIKRNRSPINSTILPSNYVHMVDSRLN